MRAGRASYLAGLLGQGVQPSLTPELHEREAARQGLRYVYTTIDLGDDELTEQALRGLLRSAVRLGFNGLNVMAGKAWPSSPATWARPFRP